MEFLWSCAILYSLLTIVEAQSDRPPHIVFIVADDMGWNDVSFHGSDQIHTPNIDTLAYQGIILQQYYSEAICTPARTAMLTGKYPMRLGMQGFPLYNSEDRGIPLSERLLPSYLKELGYATHLVGKWHVGMSKEEYLPTNRGYDTHFGTRGGFIDYYTYNKIETWPDGRLMFGLDLFDGDVPQEKEQRYIIDALTDRSIQVIRQHNSSQPLFLHLTHNAPHAGNEGGALQPPLYTTVKNKHIANSDRRLYADIVTHLDRSIGQLVRALADKNILDDTLIIFVSDNGAPTSGQFGNKGVNLPFRGKKETPWEGAVRVPAFMWHSKLNSHVWHGLMHISDWLPTLVQAAGGQIDRSIDGISLWNSITENEKSKRDEVLIAVYDGVNSYAAYRAGDYKIVIGNVSGVSNDYYGSELLANKETPTDYLSALKTSDTAKALKAMGCKLTREDIEDKRNETRIVQLDTIKDATPCIPTPARGCLYNLRKDPTESHDLSQQAKRVSAVLLNRLKQLWSMQQKRGPLNLQSEADPARFGYIWTPWLTEPNEFEEDNNLDLGVQVRSASSFNVDNVINTTSRQLRSNNDITLSNCNNFNGLRQFMCILRSVF